MEDLNKKDIEEKEKKTENVATEKEKTENQEETFKIKIGTVGNFVLLASCILVIGTGALTYYLIHSEKDNYDKQYNEIISNLINEENIIDEEEVKEPGSVANIIDSAISDATLSSNPTTTTDENTKKLMNESLVVLYNGLILDTTKMDEVALQYIDSKKEESDKYIITYYSYLSKEGRFIMKKRLLTAVLMLCLAFSLVACGGNGSDKDTQKNNTENSQQDDAQANDDTDKEDEDTNVDDGKIEYTVTLLDANGAPVAGKMVQVCNSATCFAPVATDENGVAVFRLEEADDYKAKELTQGDDAYVYFEAGSTELTIQLTEAN